MKKIVEKYFSFVRAHLPQKPQESCVGLDIGPRSCRAVEVIKSNGDDIKVVNWVVEPYSNGDLKGAIRKILSRFEFSSKNVFTGLTGQGILIRFIKMPRMSLKQLRQSIYIEIDKYFPFSKDQVSMDCHIIDDDKAKDNKILTLVAVAKKELIKQRLDLILSLDLQSNSLGLNAIALSNVFTKFQLKRKDLDDADHPSEKTVAVLDIAEAKSTLVVLEKNMPKFTRDISVGGKNFAQKVANVLNLDSQKLEDVRKDISPETASEILSACRETLSSLVSEIRLSFDYFTSENTSEVSKLYLTGESSNLPGMNDFFFKELGISVEYWNPVNALSFSDKVSQEQFSENIYQLSIALGLCLSNND